LGEHENEFIELSLTVNEHNKFDIRCLKKIKTSDKSRNKKDSKQLLVDSLIFVFVYKSESKYYLVE